jgi:hypothetical protein
MTYNTAQNKKTSTKDMVTCTQCDFGYTLTIDLETDNQKCIKYNDYTGVKADRYAQFFDGTDFEDKTSYGKPGCDKSTDKKADGTAGDKKCVNGTARYGFSNTGACQNS